MTGPEGSEQVHTLGPFCPATMCPLFAKDGSAWTGEKNAACPQRSAESATCGGCAFWHDGSEYDPVVGCMGARMAMDQVAEVATGSVPLQGIPARRFDLRAEREYDCARASECQWQLQQPEGRLCPPRQALAVGADPRVVAW